MIHGKKRNKDLFRRLTENWGYTKSEDTPLDEQMAQDEEQEEEVQAEGVFDANHYCIHHGGVHHNGEIAMAEAIQHVKPDENGRISHYDMKLEDGTILENVAAEDIQVTNASLAKEHQMKRDHDAMKDDDEELDEGGAAHKKDPRNRRQDDPRAKPMEEAEEAKSEHEDEEPALEEMAAQAQGAAAGAAAPAAGEEEEEEDPAQAQQPVAESEDLEEAIRRVVTKVLSDIVTK